MWFEFCKVFFVSLRILYFIFFYFRGGFVCWFFDFEVLDCFVFSFVCLFSYFVIGCNDWVRVFEG